MDKKAYIILLVVFFLGLLVISALAIVNLGSSEAIQTRVSNDLARAHFAASAGAEIMYCALKSKEGTTVTWPQLIPSADSSVMTRVAGGDTIGTFTASADTTALDVFAIVSEADVGGTKARVTVKYGFDSPFTNGYPIGCMGNMSLAGTRWLFLRSWVRAEGPIAAGGTITTNNYVQLAGDELENQTFTTPNFWQTYDAASGTWSSKQLYDSNGDGQLVTDTTGKGYVDLADCGGDPAKEAIFYDDDINNDVIINDKDGFVAYYTIELNKQGYGIGPGESNYYEGNQSLDPWSVPAGTPIIFVNGNADILFNTSSWWGSESNTTIVTAGDITIVQPTNGSDDTLTLIAGGDVITGGIRAFGGVRGNVVIFSYGDFSAYYGGRTDGTIFAMGNVDIDTVLPIPGLLNRDLNRSDLDWSDPGQLPLGLPPNFNKISLSFRIKNEESQYRPVWQEN